MPTFAELRLQKCMNMICCRQVDLTVVFEQKHFLMCMPLKKDKKKYFAIRKISYRKYTLKKYSLLKIENNSS